MKSKESIVSHKQISRSDVQDLHSRSAFFRPFLQPKLAINNSNDKYEQEADAMVDKIMNKHTPFIKARSLIQTQRKEINAEEISADSSIENYTGNLSGSGQLLPKEVRSLYEPKFGYDFSNVKVHTDAVAAKSAQSINALAYTSGNNIVFNEGQYSPETDNGKRLLAHELTHVVQQQDNKTSIQRDTKPKPEVKSKCTWGDYTFEEITISGIRILIGMATDQRAAIGSVEKIAAQIVSDNKIIADTAFRVKTCIISPNTTRFALLNGEPVLVLDPVNANVETVRHEMGHAVSHFLLNNKTFKINSKVESEKWLAGITDIFLQLNAITIKNIKGEEMYANFIVDPTEWNPGASAEHPGDVDEFFASTKEAFQTNKKALNAVFVKYGKQNSKIAALGKQLIQLLEFLFNAGGYPKTGTVSSKTDIGSSINSLSKPSKVEDTMFAHQLTDMLLNPDKRPDCK